MDALEKLSFLYLRNEAELAVWDCIIEPTAKNYIKSDDLCERLSGYVLSKFGAKYAGPVEGPRRNHGQP